MYRVVGLCSCMVHWDWLQWLPVDYSAWDAITDHTNELCVRLASVFAVFLSTRLIRY